MTVNQTLNNQQGEMLSDNGLIVKDNGNLSLNNQDGLIQAKNQVHLTAKTLEQEGSIKTQGDLTVRLKDSFTLNNAFEVGNNLDFSTQGDFTNNVALLIGNSAALSANQIINTASGEISSKNSKLTANEITNRGLIDGEQTLLNATQINNIGSGRIYGDHLALGSNQLINREENGSSATIAARKRLDFGVNKIINSNGSTMMSLGTMHFGKTLDENHQAVGLADSVQNHNAVIEALGRISFNVKGVENQHKLLKLEMQETSRIPIFEYSFGNEPQRYAKDTEGLTKIKRDNDSSRWGTNRNVKNLYALRLPDGRESEEWREYDYIRTINESMIILAVYDEAKIISGDKIDFYSSDVKNADSKIIANTGIEYHQGAKIDNNSTLGVLITTEKGKMTQFYNGKACAKKIFGKCVDHYRTTKSDTFIYNHETNSTKTFDLWEYSPNKNEKIVLGKDLEPQTKAKNVSLETVSITGSDTNSNDSTVKIQLTPTLDEKDKHTIVDSGQVIGKLDTTVEHFDATKLGELEMPTIKTHLPDINLPQASLYKINPEATNGYIVETDPKFTDRRKWLSSDYMFEQLRHNHDNVHKRLGDGFYEQRLINEQINQLTGRRFIAGYNNDLEQYKALMNSGVKYAKQFNLAVGVGLTAKQMSELTTDMVWLVNKEITLADGRKVTALVPQVYLVARNSDITSRGAVISANQIIGSADKIENSGVIAGLDLTRLHSNQLENRGAVLGKNVDLSAQQTLINLGGTIGAVDFLSLYGGKGVEIASTLSHSENTENTFFRTQLDRLASVKVTGDNGRLNIQSENDVTVKAASLNSAGSINIGAEKSLNITTLKTQNREHYNGNADNYYRLDQTQEVGNRISAKGNIRAVSGGDMVVRQSDISSESGKVLLGSRQGDVRIEAGRAEERLETARKSTSRGMFSKTTSTYRYTHDISEAIGSNIDGRKVNVIAQSGDVLVKGSSVVGDEALGIYGNNVSIVSDVNTHY
ncbi:S-layer family protein [Bibersteinia trehalosi]